MPTPKHAKPLNLTTVTARIDEYFKKLRPVIHGFLTNPTMPNWEPPDSVDNETRNFYKGLAIPLFHNKPSLLLHELGNTPNPNVDALFRIKDRENRFVRVLCNTSGSGKTRLLFEGLCRHWGFYFVAAQGTDGIGTRDLGTMIARMASSPGWIENIFMDPNPEQVLLADAHNELIASNRIEKVLLARWTVFRLFIEVAKEINGGVLHDNIRRDWLLFQILPCTRVDGVDPFSGFIHCLVGWMTNDLLQQLTLGLEPPKILGPAFNPEHDSFFFAFDEAQVAAKQHLGAFADTSGKQRRPVLCPIIQCLRQFNEFPIQTIVSGTGFSLKLFTSVATSGVCMRSSWDVVYDTGEFSDQDTQLAYISRYLPSPFLVSPSGESLKIRMYEWLRGRHRFTVRCLEKLLTRGWKANQPVSPHKLLNAYVLRLADLTPIDADTTFLEEEEGVEPVEINTFEWEKIQQEDDMLEELSKSIYNYMTRGQYPIWTSRRETLVEYGLGRFKGKTVEVAIEEPLALVSIVRYFERQNLSLDRNIWRGLQDDKGTAFEELLLLAITRLLRDGRCLKDIFQFHPTIPDWASETAQIVTRNSSGDLEHFSIVDAQPLAPSSGISFYAKNPEDVELWLERGQAGWCLPGTLMGPDLMARLQLSNGRLVLLAIQAKRFFTRNKETLTAGVTAKAIRSLIPSKFFASTIKSNTKRNTKKEIQQPINSMLTAIDKDGATGQYNILRLVGAFPLAANLDSNSTDVRAALREDNHALAQLTSSALASVLATTNYGSLSLSAMAQALKKKRGEVDDEAEAGQSPRKAKRTRGEVDDEAEAGQSPQKAKRARREVDDEVEAGQSPGRSKRTRGEAKAGPSTRKSQLKRGKVDGEAEAGQPPRRSKRKRGK